MAPDKAFKKKSGIFHEIQMAITGQHFESIWSFRYVDITLHEREYYLVIFNKILKQCN